MVTLSSATHPLSGGELSVRVSARSDRGRVRRINEDSYVAEYPVFLIADGMGGHDHGDRASQAVTAAFAGLVGHDSLSQHTVLDALRLANDAVRQISADAQGTSIAGSTLSGVAFVADANDCDRYWMAFNIGDSRVYEWEDDTLAQLTVDHSAVQELLDDGSIRPEDAATHPQRNIITRAVGFGENSNADIWMLPAGGRQLFLICSDGLTKEVSDERIAQLLRLHLGDDAVSIADVLVEAALTAGGSDNVSVVIVDSTLVLPERAFGSAEQFREETLPRI